MHRHFAQSRLANLVVVSPDVGGVKNAGLYAQALGAELAIVTKKRKSATEIEHLNVIGEVEGRDVLIVDDITETAGTLVSAAAILKSQGAKTVCAAVSHAILTDLALERLAKSDIAELVTTNSVPVRTCESVPVSVLCIAELLGEGIKRIHNDESVSTLFELKATK